MTTDKTNAAPQLSAQHIALAGMVALAVAMGIGRFAFTPLLPIMMHDSVIDIHRASWLASANYLGYLVGALLGVAQPTRWRFQSIYGNAFGPYTATQWLRAGLIATVVLTLSMALPWASAWPLWRFLAGVASAFVFLQTSGWCLAQLAARNANTLGGVIYAGPGIGIVVSGLLGGVLVALDVRAVVGWALFGVLAALLCWAVWRVFQQAITAPVVSPPTSASTPRLTPTIAPNPAPWHEAALLAVAYGLGGFGYIITATFLPVIARTALPGSPWVDWFWPLFGCAVMAGALLTTRIADSRDKRLALALCSATQALGVATTLILPTLAGFAMSSLLLGLPFTVLTYFAMQEARRVRPHNPAALMGMLTVLYGIGQMVGPPLAGALIARSSATQGFALALTVASSALAVGAMIFTAMSIAYPLHRNLRKSP